MGIKRRQKNVVRKKNLAHWEQIYGGTTAEAIARRVINKFDPNFEEPDCISDAKCGIVPSCINGDDNDENRGSKPTIATTNSKGTKKMLAMHRDNGVPSSTHGCATLASPLPSPCFFAADSF
jgi:hypothetical protein